MNTHHSLAFAPEIEDIDRHVITQAIALQCPSITITNGTGDTADIILTQDMIESDRIGAVLDKIERALYAMTHYELLSYGRYKLDWQKAVFTINDKSYDLSERERDLLTELLLAGEQGCTRDHLLGKIWGYRADLETHALETQIYRLRQKIEEKPDDPQILVTIDNGYKLV